MVMVKWPKRARIVEVGPRDGLQNESVAVTTADKLAFIDKLVGAGLADIEVAAFVSPRAVPQMADASEVVAGLALGSEPATEPDTVAVPGVRFSALVPNSKGLERALACGLKRVAVFTAASDTFARKNINMTVAESLATFAPVVRSALAAGATVRAYVSTCFVCPYEGEIRREAVRETAEKLLEMGADEVSISDTIGAAAPRDVFDTVGYCLETIPVDRLALHFHDTYGTALANVVAGLQLGVVTFDASAGGLGGCPFAPGATGNLATEDLVYMLERMGIATGVKLSSVADASRFMSGVLGKELPSRNLHRLMSQNA